MKLLPKVDLCTKVRLSGLLEEEGETELLLLTQGSSAKNDMMDGINTSWNRVNAHMAIKNMLIMQEIPSM